MPQINRIRVNNVKYNFGTQVYDDFMMRFNCRNTIYDLANGGGKSLLMLLLLQNVIPNCTLDEKQPIEKLFRAGCDNTVIHSLVEWKLDACYQKDNFKYMTTGFCARKGHSTEDVQVITSNAGSQEIQNNQDTITSQDTVQITGGSNIIQSNTKDNASIEYFNYCIFYRKFGDNDIKNLPLVSNGERITYNGLKAYLRDLEKKDFNVSVKIFDRKGDYQSFISKYGIFESEWEIIRGINKTEGHVRTYFETNYRTSRKVVEDLLIEEIIQKSFNNRLAVSDDEGKMAQTLLDIKDKLVELSKKNSRISSYSNQMSALDDFAEYVSTFQEMYERKERLKKQLYDMLISCKQMLIKQEKNQFNVENNIEQKLMNKEKEQKNIQTAEVMTEQNSLKSIESLIAANEKILNEKNHIYEEKKKTLTLMESANDYHDYQQYRKSMEEVELAVNNRMRDNKDILIELESIAIAYKKVFEQHNKELHNHKEKLIQEQNTVEGLYKQTVENQREYDNKVAAAKTMTEYIEQEISDNEKELSQLMAEAGLIVAENANGQYAENNNKIEKIGHDIDEAEKHYQSAKKEFDDSRGKLAGNVAMLEYLNNQFEKSEQNNDLEIMEKERLESLKSVYLQHDIKDLSEVILDTYNKTSADCRKLEEEEKKIKVYIENVQSKKYSLDTPMRNRLKKYLELHYTGCVIEGYEWLQGLNAQIRKKILEKIPFAEYAFVITRDFEKIRQDSTLANFQLDAYTVPIISSAILNCADSSINEEINLNNIAFARKELSFLNDESRCDAEIKLAQEELETVSVRLSKMKDRVSVVWEDYIFVMNLQAISSVTKVNDKEEISEQIKINEKDKQLLSEKLEQLEIFVEEKAKILQELMQKKIKLEELNANLEKIMILNQAAAQKYAELDKERKAASEYREKSVSLQSSVNETKERLEQLKKQENQLLELIDNDENIWKQMQSYISGESMDTQYGTSMTRQELETRFAGLKAALDKENSDISDKEALLSHYKASMEKCKASIVYRGNVFDEVESMFINNSLAVSSPRDLLDIKQQLESVNADIRQTEQELNAQNALMNRLEGSISHGIAQIESKFEIFEPFECDNIESYIKQHKEYVNRISEEITESQLKLKAIDKETKRLAVIEKDLERIVINAQMTVPENVSEADTDMILDISIYESVQKDFDKLIRLEFKKQDEFNKHKIKLIDRLNSMDGAELAQEVKLSVNIPENAEQTIQLVQRIRETNTFIQLEKERISKGIEDMEKIKENFENRCLQTCSNIKTELDRLPKLSNITMDKEVISIIGLQIPYVKEELYKERMSAYIDETILIAESFESIAERLKYIRNRLAWKRLFSVIVTDMNSVRINLYKRERIKDQSRYLRYEEAVGSTGQSQGIYIQFLIAIINYISSINASTQDGHILGKAIFIDNPFGAAKDIYIWEPIFKLLKTNHVQLIVPARGATPAITGRFEVNYILGQKLIDKKQQTVVVDYYSQANNEELEYTRMSYEQTVLTF